MLTFDKKSIALIDRIYRDLYANSTPPGDYDKLIEQFYLEIEAYPTEEEKRKNAHKHVFYNKHFISNELMKEIMDKHLKKSRVRKDIKEDIRNSLWLGCSPSTKIN